MSTNISNIFLYSIVIYTNLTFDWKKVELVKFIKMEYINNEK